MVNIRHVVHGFFIAKSHISTAKFYTFKINDVKNINENVDNFLKLVAYLNNLGVYVSDEVQAILLLSLLPQRYD